jgi:hypothetical protein
VVGHGDVDDEHSSDDSNGYSTTKVYRLRLSDHGQESGSDSS